MNYPSSENKGAGQLCSYLRLCLRIGKIRFSHDVALIVLTIRKTCPCNVYPLKPHIYIVKLGFTGVYLFFLFLLQNIDCGYSLGSNVYPQSMF